MEFAAREAIIFRNKNLKPYTSVVMGMFSNLNLKKLIRIFEITDWTGNSNPYL